MNFFRFLVCITAGVLVSVAILFASAAHAVQASEEEAAIAETKKVMCDLDKVRELLAQDEQLRNCVVEAVAQNEFARKLVIQKMFANPGVREKIMEQIARHPELRKKMEEKLESIQPQGSMMKNEGSTMK